MRYEETYSNHQEELDFTIQLNGTRLGYQYGKDAWLFRNVDFTVNAGEIVGLTGPSGCGKTTLGRTLAGYIKPIEGEVAIQASSKDHQNSIDKRLDKETTNSLWVGYQPVQMVFQHPERAVNPNWRLNRTLREGWSPSDAFLETLEIQQDWLQRYPNELSGGELQRICIARALGPETRFLIADEMTTMLDAITQAQIWKVMIDIVKERKLGLLIISHDLTLVNRLCHRVVSWNKLVPDNRQSQKGC